MIKLFHEKSLRRSSSALFDGAWSERFVKILYVGLM